MGDLLESDFFCHRVVDTTGNLTPEVVSVRRFNEYYRLEMATFDTEHLGTKLSDAMHCVLTIPISTLINLHRFIPVKLLKIIARLHDISVFNLNIDNIRSEIEVHECSTSCPKKTYFVFSFLRNARPYVENKFCSVVLTERVRQSEAVTPQTFRAPVKSDQLDCHDHLDPPSKEVKLAIIREWQEELSAVRLQRCTCAVCAKLVAQNAVKLVEADDIDLTLLRNDKLPEIVWPRDYNFQAYSRALLHPNGMFDCDQRGRLRICRSCMSDLDSGKMPRFALSNWLYYGRNALPLSVKEAFDQSSQFEKAMISRARTNSICCSFKNPEVDIADMAPRENAYACGKRGIKGNVIVAPLDVVRLNECLPPSVDTVRDTLCVLFLGRGARLTRENIAKFSPVLARKSRVKLLIQFLLEHNPHYGPVQGFKGFNEKYLNDLFEGIVEEGLPAGVDITYLDQEEVMEGATSSYVPGSSNTPYTGSRNTNSELLMENVGFTLNDDTPKAFRSMKVAAVQRVLTGKPYLRIVRGDRLIPDFNNPYILSWILPHLDPWGIGGFYHPKRTRYISMEEQLAHMLGMDDEIFQKDCEFAFIFYNIIRKKNISHNIRFSAPARRYQALVKDILEIDPIRLFYLGEKYKADPMYKTTDPTEKKIITVLRDINLMAHHVPGSAAQKVEMRNEIRSLMVQLGAPTLFVTLNPSDKDNLLVQVLAGAKGDLENVLRGTELGEWQRRVFAAKNPAACAKFFDTVIRGFIKVILRYGSAGVGLYGKCVGYYGTVEAQGRGTLHCHMLVWLRGHPSPTKLRNLLQQGSGYRERLIPWLEGIMQGDYIGTSGHEVATVAWDKRIERDLRGGGSIHPGATTGPLIAEMSPNDFWSEFEAFTNQLLVEYNIHEHTATCWKYLTKGQPQTSANCRVGITGEVWPETVIDCDTMAITVKKTHPRMTHFTDLLTFLLKCNVDVKFVGAGAEANAFTYYLTNYITKSQLSMHVGVSALSSTILRLNTEISSERDMSPQELVKAITVAVNSMMGRQEISHQQVMSYLVGGGDHYTHAQFHTFNWGEFVRYVDMYWNEDNDGNDVDRVGNVSLALREGEVNVSNQRLDYMFRPGSEGFEQLCVYDFMSYARKIPLSSTRSSSETTTASLRGSKRGQSPASRFTSMDHPQYSTHGVRMRTTPVVPVMLGPSFKAPLRNSVDSEYGATQILILFKPWRHPSDLKSNDQTWCEAFEQYNPLISDWHKSLIENIGVLVDAKEDGHQHLVSRREKRKLPRRFMTVDESMVGEGYSDEIDLRLNDGIVSVYGFLEWTAELNPQPERNLYHERLCKLLGEALALEVMQMYSLEANGGDNISVYTNPIEGDHEMGVLLTDCVHGIPEDYEEQLQCMTKKRHDHISAAITGANRGHTTSSGVTRVYWRPIVEVTDLGKSGGDKVLQIPLYRMVHPGTQGEWDLVISIIHERNLHASYEQLRAFLMIARHVIHKDEQLLMYISGMGGSGKSYLVKAVVLLLQALGRRHEILLGAYTGIASVLIGGATLHSLIFANAVKAPGVSEKLMELWRNVKLLIIDEISMVGAAFLALLSSRLRIAKGDDPVNSSQIFGGVSVICLGDFCQLKPPQQQSLFADTLVSKPSFEQTRDNHSLDAMTGAYLWRQFRTVVNLKRNHRQSEDPTFSTVLQNIRLKTWKIPINGEIWNDKMYFSYFKQRLLSVVAQANPASLPLFLNAPVIVGHKVLRDALNVILIQYHSKNMGQQAHLYHAHDSFSRRPVPAQLQELLWGLPSNRCQEMLGKLPMFVGMKVMITENLSIHNGIVNGAEGTISGIRYHCDSSGRRYADAVYVKVPGCDMNLPGLESDVAVIGVAPCTIPFAFDVHCPNISARSFRRRQIPILPAYSYTDYKSQGRTLKRCIVDLVTAKGQGVYVMLSRVKSLDGLLILRWFSPTQIFQRFSEELRNELRRLDELDVKTEEYFRRIFDVEIRDAVSGYPVEL